MANEIKDPGIGTKIDEKVGLFLAIKTIGIVYN